MTGPSSDRPGGAGARAAEPGVWFGVDVGTVRIGVARSDATGLLAFPVETIARDRKRGSDIERLAALLAEYDAVGVVVGMPVTLAGRRGASAEMAQQFGDAVARRITPAPVTYFDERLSTVTATRILSAQGVRGPAGRAVVDQVAAVQILQGWLDSHLGKSGRAEDQ